MSAACGATTAGCGRCGSTSDALRDALRVELGRVGVTDRVDVGAREHLVVMFGASVLVDALAALDDDVIRGGRSQQTIGMDATRRATVELDLRVSLRSSTLVMSEDGTPGVDFDLAFSGSSVRTRTVDEDDVRMLEGGAHVVAPVSIEPRGGGFALVARPDEGRVLAVEARTTDDRSGAFVDGLVADRLRAAVASSSVAVDLVVFDALELGDDSLSVAPAHVDVAPDGSVAVGLVTALQPLGAYVAPARRPAPDEVIIALHPDLPAAAARHAWARGDAPRTIDRDGRATVGGDIAVTLDDVRVRGDRVDWSGMLWCDRVGPCGTAPWTGTAQIVVDPSGALTLQAADAPPSDAPGGPVTVSGAPSRAVIERVDATLRAPIITVAGRDLLRRVVDVQGREGAIEIVATVPGLSAVP